MAENVTLAATRTHLCYACFPIPLPLSPLIIQLTFSFLYHTYTINPPPPPTSPRKGNGEKRQKFSLVKFGVSMHKDLCLSLL